MRSYTSEYDGAVVAKGNRARTTSKTEAAVARLRRAVSTGHGTEKAEREADRVFKAIYRLRMKG